MKKAYSGVNQENSDVRRIHIYVDARKWAGGDLKSASHYTPEEMRELENSI